MALWNRVWNLVRGDRHRSELDEELAFHMAMRKSDNVASGMPLDEAVHDARSRFGNIALERERTRDAGVVVWLDGLAQDLRYAGRSIKGNRSVAALVIAALALGVGANTAIFTVANALILRSLPVKDPAGLVNVAIGNFQSWGYIEENETFTYALWTDFMKRQDVVEGAFAYSDPELDVVLHGEMRRLRGAIMTAPAFRTLGLEPIVGRAFTEADERQALAAPVVVISDGLWRREYNSDPGAMGRTLTIEGKPFTVIGVMPARFFGMTVGRAAEFYIPLAAEPYIRAGDSAFNNGIRYWIVGFGRLRAGTGADTARQRLAALSRLSMQATLPSELPESAHADYLRQTFVLRPAASGISYAREQLEYPLALLAGIAGMLLVLACVTVANLLLTRATARHKEIAVRVSLGASRARIARQFFIEGMLMAIVGAAIGVVVAQSAGRWLMRSYVFGRSPLVLDVSVDWRVLAFAVGTALASAVAFALAPALQAVRIDPAESLKTVAGAGSPAVLRVRRFLLGAQVAAAVVLVTGAVLFGTTLRNLLAADRGFRSDGVVIAQLDFRRLEVAKEALRPMYSRLRERMERIPSVASAALSYVTPMSGNAYQFDVTAETAAGPKRVHTYFNGISPEFLETFGTRIMAGRGFTASDRAGSPAVAIVNPAFAARAFGTTDVIGRRIATTEPETRTFEIVGIAENAKYRDLRQPVPPTVYAPLMQSVERLPLLSIALRCQGPAAPVARELRRILTSEYPNLSFDVSTLSADIEKSVAHERAFAFVCSWFGALALALAAIGVYGVLSYMIARRRPEIGIRLALGATPAQVRRLVYGQSFVTCAAGAAAGCTLAAWAARFTTSMLYGVNAAAPAVYIAVLSILAAVAAVATLVPAVRASRTEPMQVLRCE